MEMQYGEILNTELNTSLGEEETWFQVLAWSFTCCDELDLNQVNLHLQTCFLIHNMMRKK